MSRTITMIMPVYNTEKYLNKAIESVINQTFKDFDFYIINNGCTDNSGQIIENWAAKDERIHVIKNEHNMLISDARNAAIDQAESEFICFADSDDWIEQTMLEDMVTAARRNNADLVVTGFYMEYFQQGKHSCYKVIADSADYSKEEFEKKAHVFFNKTLLAVPWNKLYRLEHIRKNNIRYRNTKWEDHHFNMDYLMDCGNISIIGKAYYHYYRSRPGSDSEVVYDKQLYQKRKEHFTHTMQVYNHWGFWDKETEVSMANYYSGRMLQCIQEASSFRDMKEKQKKAIIKDILNDPLTKQQLKLAKPDSLAMRTCLMPMRCGNATLCYVEGNVISFVKKRFSNTFYRIRAKEAQGASVSNE